MGDGEPTIEKENPVPSRRQVLEALMGCIDLVPKDIDKSNDGPSTFMRASLLPSPEEARRIITLQLSLILPDKAKHSSLIDVQAGTVNKVVQEDFIIMDLIKLAKETGLFDEFQKIFESIIAYRKMQFVFFNHLAEPKDINHPENILGCVLKFREDSGGNAPSLASIGCGSALVEQTLSNLGLANNPVGIEVDMEAEADKGGRVKDKMTFVKVAGKTRNPEELKNRIFELAGKRNIFFFGDSLHHTPDPNAYIDKAWEQIDPGGYLVVSEPFRFQHDEVTKEALNPLDSTPFHGSMQTLTSHQAWINRLIAKGGEVISAKMEFGAVAGLNDVYHRVFVVIQKPAESKAPQESGEWKFIDHCPEFHNFLNPVYEKLNAQYEVNFPSEVSESEFTQLLEQIALILSTNIEHESPPQELKMYLNKDRWNAHSAFNFLELYIEAFLKKDQGWVNRLERLITHSSPQPNLLELLNTLKDRLAKLNIQNKGRQIHGYSLQKLRDFLTARGFPPLRRETEAYLVDIFLNSVHREGTRIARIKARVFANDLIIAITETLTPERAQEIIRQEIKPVLDFIDAVVRD